MHVEIDTKCEYPNKVIVVVDERKAYNLQVEYNWRPPKCDGYEVFGHTVEKCSRLNKNSGLTSLWLRKEGGMEATCNATKVSKDGQGEVVYRRKQHK